jgi:hypothetical protein
VSGPTYEQGVWQGVQRGRDEERQRLLRVLREMAGELVVDRPRCGDDTMHRDIGLLDSILVRLENDERAAL